MPGGLLDYFEASPSFSRLATRRRGRLWRRLRSRMSSQVLSGEHYAFAGLIGIDAKHCSDRDNHAVGNTTETGTERHFVVTQAQAVGSAPTAVEDDLAVTDERPRNLHADKLRIDHQVGRKAAIANPFMQRPQ